MKTHFDYGTRMAMQVATAISEEITNNTVYGREIGEQKPSGQFIRPVLLSVSGNTFRFEGGTVVALDMVELSQYDECWRDSQQEWVVTGATVRYYRRDPKTCRRLSALKVEETWNHEKLAVLKNARHWHDPRVLDPMRIEGEVAIFWDNGSQNGYIEADPDFNQSGYYTKMEEFPYKRFLAGDLERARREAVARLEEYKQD